MEHSDKLSPNELAFIALTNEYCKAIEDCPGTYREDFVLSLLKLLPRIYITSLDLIDNVLENEDGIGAFLDESVYDQIRANVSAVMADEDVYLEVFVKDMKYSDTPISATISENLADLYQEFYNFIASVNDATTSVQRSMIMQCKDDFNAFWGQALCNVLRALHNIHFIKEF